MYAVLSVSISSGAINSADIKASVKASIGKRLNTQVLADTLVIRLRDDEDFNTLAEALENVRSGNATAFSYVLFKHRAGPGDRIEPRTRGDWDNELIRRIRARDA